VLAAGGERRAAEAEDDGCSDAADGEREPPGAL